MLVYLTDLSTLLEGFELGSAATEASCCLFIDSSATEPTANLSIVPLMEMSGPLVVLARQLKAETSSWLKGMMSLMSDLWLESAGVNRPEKFSRKLPRPRRKRRRE